ncbi:MAG: hypothetical protein QME96_15715, partial [Myxococcota bacterium]|nr:hypothetical protein [Myxococcota bacterium]
MRSSAWCLAVIGTLVAALAPSEAAATTSRITVRNRTGGVVCYVYVSPCASDHWGDDILAEDTLPDGESATIRVQTGCWDLKAEDCSRNVVATQRALNVTGPTTWTLGGSQAAAPSGATLRINNRSGAQVCFVYVSPCASSNWGDDILAEDVLPDGSSTSVRVQTGCWDLKAEDCSGNVV